MPFQCPIELLQRPHTNFFYTYNLSWMQFDYEIYTRKSHNLFDRTFLLLLHFFISARLLKYEVPLELVARVHASFVFDQSQHLVMCIQFSFFVSHKLYSENRTQSFVYVLAVITRLVSMGLFCLLVANDINSTQIVYTPM